MPHIKILRVVAKATPMGKLTAQRVDDRLEQKGGQVRLADDLVLRGSWAKGPFPPQTQFFHEFEHL